MNRDFKGIWIPRDIWLQKDLKPTYRVFLAEIDSLDKGNGCWAKNEHFSKMFDLSKSRCSEILNMLQSKGYITIDFENDGDGEMVRKLRLSDPFGKSNPPSENRTTPSENRTTPSENRTPIYKDEIYNKKYSERDARAYGFLVLNCPGRLEQEFLIKYKSQIDDFEKFVADFNDKADVEELPYRDSVLMARLCSYARNWIMLSGSIKKKNSGNDDNDKKYLIDGDF